MLLGAKQVHREGGYEGARKNIGGNHGKHDCLGQRRKQITRHALEEEHGQKDDADAQRRDQGGHGNLGCAIEDCLAQLIPVFQKPFNVFDGDRGVVDQDSDREGKSAQGHGVDRLADQAKHDHRASEWRVEWK